MTHLLDTSAILAHYLDESGADEVESLLAQGPSVVALDTIPGIKVLRLFRQIVNSIFTRPLC